MKINELESKILCHNKMSTSTALQKSRYVMMDNDIDRLQRHYSYTATNLQEELDKLQVVRGGGQSENTVIQKQMR